MSLISVIKEIVECCNSSLVEFFYYNINQYNADNEIIDLLKKNNDNKKQAIKDLLKN